MYRPTAAALGVALILAAPAWSTQTAIEPASATFPTGKLVAAYAEFAGSQENAASLVNGLRTGAPITLADPAGAPVTFSPPTGPMGYGNVRIVLALARTRLASRGIAQPRAAELEAALMGSTTPDAAPGILSMRASGMGWGKIANTLGFKLGAVVSGKAGNGGKP